MRRLCAKGIPNLRQGFYSRFTRSVVHSPSSLGWRYVDHFEDPDFKRAHTIIKVKLTINYYKQSQGENQDILHTILLRQIGWVVL